MKRKSLCWLLTAAILSSMTVTSASGNIEPEGNSESAWTVSIDENVDGVSTEAVDNTQTDATVSGESETSTSERTPETTAGTTSENSSNSQSGEALLLPENNGESSSYEETDALGTYQVPTEDLLTSSEIEPLSDGVSSMLEASLAAAPKAGQANGGKNYMHDTVGRPKFHDSKTFSTTVDGTKNGIVFEKDGRARAYKDGRYYIDGSFRVDGIRYYADENGYLVGGWLKTVNDNRNDDPNSIDDLGFFYHYYDPKTYKILEGYQMVDGLPHYFNPGNGVMRTLTALELNGKFYYTDRFGICSEVKLMYGNTLSSADNLDNQSYLARNQVKAVDPNRFNGQNGEYSFRPRMFPGVTTCELFGLQGVRVPGGYCAALMDKSICGKAGAIYRNVGRYKGREMDLVMTVKDWTEYSLNGDSQVGFLVVFENNIGTSMVSLQNITMDLQFRDHETQQPVKVKGYATFADIDITQTLSILSPVDEVYVSNDSVLYKDPASLSFTSPFDIVRSGSVITDSDTTNWVQANYDSDHLTYRFGASFDQFRFTFNNMPIAVENRFTWRKDYTGNPRDYSFIQEDRIIQSWQGLYYQRLGRVSIPPLTKTVSDSDESHVLDNRLSGRNEAFVYTLSHAVPGENPQFFYSSYQVSDAINPDLKIDASKIKVVSDGNADVTDRFFFEVSGQNVLFRAKADWLAKEDFYDTTYHYQIPVAIRAEKDLSAFEGKDYTVSNKGNVFFERAAGRESSESNSVITRVQIPLSVLPTGDLTITKRIAQSEIVWAHGRPTFLFSVNGKDEQGVSHQYETSMVFQNGGYLVDSEGYAVLSATIHKVPLGSYQILELPVLDYYLTQATANTGNVTIQKVSDPAPGKLPEKTAYGTAVLSSSAKSAGITFVNHRYDYHGYRHNDLRVNQIPLVIGDEVRGS